MDLLRSLYVWLGLKSSQTRKSLYRRAESNCLDLAQPGLAPLALIFTGSEHRSGPSARAKS